MAARKFVVFLGDGMADEPLEALQGQTPLQAAATPGMDRIARQGRSGTLLTLPPGFPTSSDVANMSVLGCNLDQEYCGRGVLEAASQRIPLQTGDLAMRCNLVTRDADGRLADFAGGHLSQKDAEALITLLNRTLADDCARFYPGVSYRCLLILRGAAALLAASGPANALVCEKPDDHQGDPMDDHAPRASAPEAEALAGRLRDWMRRAADVLEHAEVNQRARREGRKPANAIWPWSPGRTGAMRPFSSRTGVSGAVISAVDVIKGLGRSLGMEVIDVPGATGYIDTNYAGKAEAAAAAIKRHDFVYLHVEAIDEVSHARDLGLKLRTIEAFDSNIVVPVMQACGPGVGFAVLPDHPVPVRLGKHTRTPVPVACCAPGMPPDSVQGFDERSALAGALGTLAGPGFMRLLYPEGAASTA